MPRLIPDREAPMVVQQVSQDGFIGIGACLDSDRTDDGYIRVANPISDTPAERAGLQPDDAILEVDGASMQGEALSTVRQRIMEGEIGSYVQLTVRRDGEPASLTIQRDWIPIPGSGCCPNR